MSTTHDDIICVNCGHHVDDHGHEGCDWGRHVGQLRTNLCDCTGFVSITTAAERQWEHHQRGI